MGEQVYDPELDEEPMWQTGDGTVMRIADMGSAHLLNAEIFMRRQIEAIREEQSAAWSASCFIQGEMASDMVDQAIDELREAEQAFCAMADELVEEIRRRGLTPGAPPPVPSNIQSLVSNLKH